MEKLSNLDSDATLNIVLRSIHPNLNPTLPEGEKQQLLTYVKDFSVTAKVKLVLKCPYFIEEIEADPTILEEGIPIQIRMTAQMNQVSIDAILVCLDYLTHEQTDLIELNPQNMLTLLTSSNLLKIYNLEDFIAEYVGRNLTIQNSVFVFNIANQIQNSHLLTQFYYFLKQVLLNRSGLASLPEGCRDDKALTYSDGVLKYQGYSTDLNIYGNKDKELMQNYVFYHEIHPAYNLLRVERIRAPESITGSDYPHKFHIIREHDNVKLLYAERQSENGAIQIYKSRSTPYSEEYIGTMENNFWGNEFEQYDHGVTEKIYAKLPQGFAKIRDLKQKIRYESNILGEAPRQVSVELVNEENRQVEKFGNLPPKWNERAEIYTLNFYGRVSRPSAKNFQLIKPDDVDTVYLMFGKVASECYHLDYRSPFTLYQATGIGLASLARKRIVS